MRLQRRGNLRCRFYEVGQGAQYGAVTECQRCLYDWLQALLVSLQLFDRGLAGLACRRARDAFPLRDERSVQFLTRRGRRRKARLYLLLSCPKGC